MPNKSVRRRLLEGAAIVFALLMAAGCGVPSAARSTHGTEQSATAPDPVVVDRDPLSHMKPSVSTSDPAPTTNPAESARPNAATGDRKLHEGDHGEAVLTVQEHLSALGYWLGTPDGRFGDLTRQAAYALQKAAGLKRSGVIDAPTMTALDDSRRPTITSTGAGHRVEINKATQLLLIIDGERITTILNTSTGSETAYLQAGRQEVPLTPSGSFDVFRQIDGEDIGPLGARWRPKYFNAGIAIHGYCPVPPYPASQGCTRVSDAAMNWIWQTHQLSIGTRVTVV